MNRQKVVTQSFALAAAAAIGAAGMSLTVEDVPQPARTADILVAPAAAVAAPIAEAVQAVQAAVSATEQREQTVTIDAAQRARLAREMDRWGARHPQELVTVIADLAETQPLVVPPTYLLSIAWSETRGKVLAVSPAGAAGLAQATPAAYLSEGLEGKLFVTTDYLAGTRAYIMKKPLGDALSISAPLVSRNTAAARSRAREQVARALTLRREGMEELEALRPVANATFFRRIAEGDDYNLRTLQELERLIERGAPRAEMLRFRKRVQKDYTWLRNLQRTGWARYERDLTARRDALLRKKFGRKPATVILTRPYEAGEYLAKVLDARFSPRQMAEFLAAHLATKQRQARELGIPEEQLDAWTAALYNGGAVNVKRMRAGLIGSLRETEKYMRAVPAQHERLERVL